ncbi:BREX-1 system adenine-specific DNA-methyltransferase PglX [Lacticaseibacillus kribbianus]|uniref:BREX-1 system adenine-specific DNA-methyltransferase PglX n=1 Tax=Lacticaseibacillus kribbianus TaxID=2926292 RepID=UPI001CD41EE5|nr:BREX-1 system adenine-specific DNA-methyltransferase PglX [Lacticaseibacillus kribbianus]
MDKHAINKFAVQARRDLIAAVTSRLDLLGIDETGAAPADARSTREAEFYRDGGEPLVGKNIGRRQELVKRLKEMAAKSDWATAFHDLIEEVAYTWFNRIIAIRFMEVNDYLPTNTRVLSSSENYSEPDIMRDALDLDEELGGYDPEERALIVKAQDRKQPVDMDAMYRMLFLKQVNKLNESLPKLFEKTDDFMTLLFTPSYNRGVIADLVEQIPEADFDIASDDSQGQVEIIGWLYQYYNSELKDAAIGAPTSHKFRGKEIASATQIFTPDWIVKYMVQNSVGKTWIRHLLQLDSTTTESELAQQFGWQYYMTDAEQGATAQRTVGNADAALADMTPEKLTVLDPAMGSGHILVYAFDLLVDIYQAEGFSSREAAASIVQSNLFGLDIDRRAYQLAYFSVMMKFRRYNRRALSSGLSPNLSTVISSKDIKRDDVAIAFPGLSKNELDQLTQLSASFENADLTGSLTDVSGLNLDTITSLMQRLSKSDNLLAGRLVETLNGFLSAARQLKRQYQIVVTNPPYMGSSRMNPVLAKFAKQKYANSKSDLFAMFLDHYNHEAPAGGYVAMVTMQSWMFLSSFEQLRIRLLNTRAITNLMHMENNVMGIAFGTAVTITRNIPVPDFVGTYHQIKTRDVSGDKIPDTVPINGNRFNRANQANFGKIPGSPIAYWASANLLHDFEVGTPMAELVDPRQGLATADNNRFLRQWFEVAYKNIKFDARSIKESVESKRKWFPYNKGGAYRKWYGNYDYVINWEDDGYEVRNFNWPNGKQRSVVRNPDYYFREAITWSDITSGQFAVRLRTAGSIHDVTGMSAFGTQDQLIEISGILNTKVADFIFKMLNPTIHLQIGNLTSFPVLHDLKNLRTCDLVNSSVKLTQADWNETESSWDFLKNNLLQSIAEHQQNWTVEAAFDQWSKEADDRFNQLKANEEELNRIFIDLYGLQDELTPEVADKDVSVRRADRPRDIKAFLSYFVGVVFGRYSLDVPSLAFAGGDWDASKYKTFQPNKDNMIVLTDSDYFGDSRDIINRLREFLTVTFGAEHLAENLRFIADSLGKKGDSPEDQIRKYFLDDFYKKDHLSTYQKRPIYWQFDSGKQGGFRALMYLHRYDEDTLAMARTSYLHPLQEAYTNRLLQLEKMVEMESSTRQRNLMTKQIAQLKKQLDEIAKYDTKLQHVANMHIAIDLDDGVLVNHELVQGGQKLLSPLK